MPKKLFITSLISLAMLVLLPLALSNNAFAIDRVFNPPRVIFGDEQDSYDLDVRRTVMNMIITSSLDGLDYPTTELETSEQMGCLWYVEQESNTSFGIPGTNADENRTDEDQCASFINTYHDAQASRGATLGDMAANTKTAGSLVGLGNMATNMMYQDAPVSVRYYASRQVENVPFMGEALAQGLFDSTVGSQTYAGPFLTITYDFWRIFRNMAYGAMAIIMIVVGIMIMTRKRLNPQTAVTVQYAIPRIVVALILITFSYPIGAVLASLAWTLKFSIDNIILTPLATGPSAAATGYYEEAQAIADMGVQGMLLIMKAYWWLPGVGLFGFLIITIAGLIAFIAYLIIVFKILVTYLKMLVNIVIAPFTFAVGAVPGHDDAIKNWFKKMMAYTLSIFAMSIVMGLTQLFAATIIVQMIGDSGILDISFVTFLAGPPLVAFVLVFGFNEARKVDKKVMEAIMGRPRR